MSFRSTTKVTLTILPLRIQNIVQGDQVLGLIHSTRAHTPQFLHVCSHAKQQPHMHAERSDVCASLAADPEDAEVAVVVELDELGLVDGSDTKLSLDGRNQGRALEQGAGEQLEDAGELGLAAGDLVVKSHHCHILLSGALLRLDESRGPVDTNNQTASDLGIKGAAVAGFFYAKHTLHPGDDFMGGRVRGFVKLHKTWVSRVNGIDNRENFLTLMTPDETKRKGGKISTLADKGVARWGMAYHNS